MSLASALASSRHHIRVLWSTPSTRTLLLFAVMEFVFLCVELVYGMWAESLALVADAVHHTLDVFALTVSLLAAVVSRLPPTFAYSYGFERVEVLAGFTVGSAIAFIGLFLVVEVVEKVLEPTEPSSAHVIPIALASLALNLARWALIQDYAFLRSERLTPNAAASSSTLLRSELAARNAATPLPVRLARENAASVAVMAAATAVEWGYPTADVIAASFVIVLLIVTILPLMRDTGRVLLQAKPASIRGVLDKVMREASTLDGVLEVRPDKCHFWTLSPGTFVGNISLRVREDANEQVVLQHVRSMFDPFVTHLTIQIEKDEWGQ
ncbi:metal tolerance protein [Thecamonas trahens ATCC 50062]|uniref:Metal tolerance protein n=1 Tax=Thecamonas trahens ATCC 50062 TaxID=461836 RepID=A0A0L0DJM5_THETB|nr:metal tolerance protein [Thecamonas trahens ATCC 50062]KNC51498.1 metal tolerance protein [Thecamonas trahens ATCC 50062]|eukprot:XP_013756156.1 metal tolerance protein [Thecamonas trahens ATCC 50062]